MNNLQFFQDLGFQFEIKYDEVYILNLQEMIERFGIEYCEFVFNIVCRKRT